MPAQAEDIRVTLIMGTFLVLFFALAIVFLISIFNKKNQVHQQEKAIIQTSYEKAILQAQVEIQAQTFDIISQEIHDNVGQILSLAKVQLNYIDQNSNEDKTMLQAAKNNISKAITDLRDIAKSLNSDHIKELGLKLMLEQALERMEQGSSIHASVSVTGQERRIDANREMIIYRIVQECLQNVVKHAQASEIIVVFIYGEMSMQIDVHDNGKGFDVQQRLEQKDGLGLQNMKKRTELLGGACNVISEFKEGTTVSFNIPYD